MPAAPSSGGGGGGQRPGDVRAGGAYVEVSAKDRLSAQMAGLLVRAKAFAASLQQIGQFSAFAGGAIFAPLAGLFGSGVNRAGEIQKMAEELGFSVGQMQRLKFAADAAGVSVEDVLRRPEKYGALMGQAIVLSTSEIKAAVQAQQALRGAFINLQTALVPVVQALVPLVKAVAEFVQQNPALTQALFVGAAALTGFGLAATLAGKSLAVLLSPVVLKLTGIAALVTALTYLGDQVFPKTLSAVKAFFGNFFGIATESIGGIVAAIGKGDFGLAVEIAGAGALAAWKRLAANMTYVWTRLKDVIVDTFFDAIAGVKLLINDLSAWILRNDFTGLLKGDLTDEQINAGRDQIANDIAAKRMAEREEARKARDAQIAEANAEAAAARKRLGELVAKAKAAAQAPIESEEFFKRVEATRGAFRVLRNANQQFGGSDRLQTKQLEELKKIAKKLTAIEQAMIQHAVAVHRALRDGDIRFK